MNIINRGLKGMCNLSQKTGNKLHRFKSTYKAAVLTKAGQDLEIEERSRQKLNSHQVRVKVSYVSVNSVDCYKFRKGHPNLPFIPGYELSGEVIEKGKDVSNEKAIVGEGVAGLSLENFGGFAEECILEADDVFRIPSELDRRDAAIIAFGHSTALYTLSKLTTLKEKEKIVISTGPAGMGLAAVDVAANIYGATVVGVVDNEELGELVRSRGAFTTIAFGPKLQKDVWKATDNKGVHIVYDAVGDYMMQSIGNCVKVGGNIFHAAPFFYETVPAPTPHSFLSIVSLKALRKQNIELYKTVVADTLELAHQGIISAHMSAKFELSEVNEGIKFIDEKKCTGKVLIHID